MGWPWVACALMGFGGVSSCGAALGSSTARTAPGAVPSEQYGAAGQLPSAPPDPGLPWRPKAPTLDPLTGVHWARVELASTCRPQPQPQPLMIVTGAVQFKDYYCVDGEVDWQRYRLVVYTRGDFTEPRDAYLVTVAQDADRLVLVIENSGPCREPGLYVWPSVVAALVPAGTQPVIVNVRAPSRGACTPTLD
jgi:hypothetical protein